MRGSNPSIISYHHQYCSALDSCFTVMDVHFDVEYFHKYRVLPRASDVGRHMNNRCTENLLVRLVRFQTACGLGPNKWLFERLVHV